VEISNFDLSVRFFLQLAVILAVCHVTGALFRRMGQSQVVSEMIAGVLMGPSLFGWLFPAAHAYVFPPASMPILFAVCQLGLVLYMFLVGLELDVGLIRDRVRSAALVSGAGIVTPFVLGAAIAAASMAHPELALFGEGVTLPLAVLFLGAAMSITAFPMLARIIHEQRIARTPLGTLALAAGSLDDAAAWCLLAIVLAAFGNAPSIAVFAIGGGVAFAAACLVPLKRLLAPLDERVARRGEISRGELTAVLLLVVIGAFITDSLRIYAVFGAFLVGVAMPRGRFAQEIRARLEPLTVSLLLPLFFVYSGLNTKIGLVSTPPLVLLAVVVLFAACLGKGVACWAAARWSGETQRDALGVGILMNARGLMELIILNIGLERGIIQPALFTVMVLMAIVTTLMATPLFERAYGRRA
jgi:Kef-type K+ transport system membrane component KefB